MKSSNAVIILNTLNKYLDSRIELVLYGRAALLLGFPNPPQEFALSKDVDAVMWLGQAEELQQSTNFWEAVERVNEELDDQGLYITHFFEEDQVILTPEWQRNICKIKNGWDKIDLYRLSDIDILLSKMMRYDPIDINDALFILENSAISQEQYKAAINAASVPDMVEIKDEFLLSSKRIEELAIQNKLFQIC